MISESSEDGEVDLLSGIAGSYILHIAASLKPEAARYMVVNDPGNLHERVDRCRANALEASAHQVLAYGFSFGRLGRHLASIAEPVCDGPVVHKGPTVVAEGSEFLNNLVHLFGIC